MTALKVRLLPYEDCTYKRFSGIRTLGRGLLLDSGTSYVDKTDVLSAAPADWVSVTEIDELPAALNHIRSSLAAYSPDSCIDSIAPGWFGAWSYNLGEHLEAITPKHTSLPLLWMGFYPALIVSNRHLKATQLIFLEGYEEQAEALAAGYLANGVEDLSFQLTSPFNGNLPTDQYRSRFNRVKDYINQGDCYQINLSREFKASYEGSPWEAYQRLRSSHSAPMGGFLEVDDWALLSLSPERFIRSVNGLVETKPIKGTRPRIDDPRLDLMNREDLMSSSKDRAENLMIVDLLRNDLGRSCKPGTVKVDKLFDIESFSNVHHLVSTVTGALKISVDVLDLLQGAFPGGSITGAPKRRAMQIIEEVEPHSREFYCGSMLYIDVCGRMDSNILIRSLVANRGEIKCWGGGGIVADSTYEAEYQEIQDKIGKLLSALQ